MAQKCTKILINKYPNNLKKHEHFFRAKQQQIRNRSATCANEMNKWKWNGEWKREDISVLIKRRGADPLIGR